MENNTESSGSVSDSGRKVVAAIVGIVLIVFLVLVAKWTGDQIRGRLTKSKPVAVVEQPQSDNLLGDKTANVATYSAIPKTGPNDWLYGVAGVMLFSGVGILKLSQRVNS